VRRLGLVLDQIIHAREGRYSTDEVVIRFVEELAAREFDRVRFCSRVRPASEDAPYALDPARFEVVPLPWYASVPSLCLRAPVLLPRIGRVLAHEIGDWRLAMAGGIHPLTPLVLRLAKRRGVPSLLWIRGDLMADIRYRLRGPARAAGLAIARTVLAAIPAGTPVLSVGRDDYPFLARMGPVHVAYSSKFGERDFVPLPRPQAAAGAPPRLLYVGRLAPEKGLEVLLDALRRVRAARPGASAPTLTLVGWDYVGSTYGAELRARVAASDLAGAVAFAGHVPYGPRLFALYDSHDALVLPSFTEGFPQVLLEAMVRGVPLVATRVGGVPRVVEDGVNGLLVPPGDAAALATALARLLSDPALSATLAAAGQRAARPYTVEVQAESVVRFLARCYPGAGFGARLSGAAAGAGAGQASAIAPGDR
jgi:glycosyltransferase involved in cell wall biosynthesis